MVDLLGWMELRGFGAGVRRDGVEETGNVLFCRVGCGSGGFGACLEAADTNPSISMLPISPMIRSRSSSSSSSTCTKVFALLCICDPELNERVSTLEGGVPLNHELNVDCFVAECAA